MKILSSHQCFSGKVDFWQHTSTSTQTSMKFSTYTPSKTPQGALIWLSGLTCTEENFIMKAGAQKYLAEQDLLLLCPDTSPRGLKLPQEHEAVDFGSGAGFYVDATTKGYKNHYRMYSYIVEELHRLLQNQFEIAPMNISLFGHSMGGHGALVIGLRNPEKFQSVSAFSPIVHPTASPWGRKAFTGYLGNDEELWKAYDACELLRSGKLHPNTLLIDQGLADPFYDTQLMTPILESVCQTGGQSCQINYREGYDHSYYFVSTFIESHIRFHAQAMAKGIT